VATQIEEIIVAADALDTKRLRPEFGQSLFRRPDRDLIRTRIV
jgi:hypothetical protein